MYVLFKRLKTLHHGEIRTHDLMFRHFTTLPLSHSGSPVFNKSNNFAEYWKKLPKIAMLTLDPVPQQRNRKCTS
jgi:hypothetical protein